MNDRYKAVILGSVCEVRGYNDQGMLILGNGERFKITPLSIKPETFRSYTLRGVSRLTFTGGQWLVDEVPLESYCARQFTSPRTSEGDTKLFTAWTLRHVLLEDRGEYLSKEYPLPSELRSKATAVAWVEERCEDYLGQTRDPNEKPRRAEFQGEIINMVTDESPPAKAFEPIFLSSFYRIQNSGETALESTGVSHIPRAVEDSVQGKFTHDVFLSHSSKDKPLVRELAARLKKDGIRVWLDEEQIKPGDSIPAKIEEGLEHSRVLVLCISANAFGSDWAQLEAGTFRFRDPLNKERRFIPLRLDDAPIKGSLAQFLYINWRSADREQEYAKLLAACRGKIELSSPGSGQAEPPVRHFQAGPALAGTILTGVITMSGLTWSRLSTTLQLAIICSQGLLVFPLFLGLINKGKPRPENGPVSAVENGLYGGGVGGVLGGLFIATSYWFKHADSRWIVTHIFWFAPVSGMIWGVASQLSMFWCSERKKRFCNEITGSVFGSIIGCSLVGAFGGMFFIWIQKAYEINGKQVDPVSVQWGMVLTGICLIIRGSRDPYRVLPLFLVAGLFIGIPVAMLVHKIAPFFKTPTENPDPVQGMLLGMLLGMSFGLAFGLAMGSALYINKWLKPDSAPRNTGNG